MEIILAIVVAAFVGLMWAAFAISKAQHGRREQAEIAQLAMNAQAEMENAKNLKTTAGQADAYGRALGYLTAAGEYPICREVIDNYDQIVARVKAAQKVLPVIGHVEKASEHRFKGRDSAEKNALLDALSQIRQYRITDEEMAFAGVMPEATGEIVEIDGIMQRLKELGWEEQEERDAGDRPT